MAFDIAAALAWKGEKEGNPGKYAQAFNYSTYFELSRTWNAQSGVPLPTLEEIVGWDASRIAEKQTTDIAETAAIDAVRVILARLDAGTATTVQIQRAVAWCVRAIFRLRRL